MQIVEAGGEFTVVVTELAGETIVAEHDFVVDWDGLPERVQLGC